MAGPEHTTRLRTRTGALLHVAVLAWLSIMVMPCTVLASSPVDAQIPVAEISPADCHEANAEAHTDAHLASQDCCCDPLSITGGEAPKNQRVDLVAISPLTHSFVPTLSFATVFVTAHPLPPTNVGLPVYLTTQRFRI